MSSSAEGSKSEPSQYTVREVDATRGESGDAAPPTSPTTVTESDDDGPEFCCPGGIYLNNPAGGFFRIFCEWIFINGVLMFGPACGIYYGNKDAYDANILRLYPDSTDGLWVALTLFAFLNTMTWITVQPLKYKGRIFGWNMKEDIWANQMLLRTMPHLNYKPEKRRNLVKFKSAAAPSGEEAADLEAQTPVMLVAMETQGEVGKLNRGTRSLRNMCENAFPIYMLAVYLSRIFPLPMFVLGVIWCVGRIAHQYMYAEKGHGFKKHLPFFAIASFAQHIMHCLVLVVALRCANLF